jgi:hypothetical protein
MRVLDTGMLLAVHLRDELRKHYLIELLPAGAARLLYGVHYTDIAALRAIRRDTLLTLGMRELTYGWNLEMQMRAARSGLRGAARRAK